MNDKNQIKVLSIEGRWGQVLYPAHQKPPSVADLLIKEQKKYLVSKSIALSKRFYA